MYSCVLDTVCLGSGSCQSKQILSTVNRKDNTLPETVFAEFLENVMLDTVGFFFMVEYNLAMLQRC